MDFRFLDNDVLILVADVGQVTAGEVPSLNAMSQEHTRRGTAQEEVLLGEMKEKYNLMKKC
jgi:hypothetical protein